MMAGGNTQHNTNFIHKDRREHKSCLPASIFLYLVPKSQERMDAEMQQLLKDIRRIGEQGKPQVTFGELFDDDQVANFYEALVGILKAAKKKGIIHYEGQVLLKGMSDQVVISIVK